MISIDAKILTSNNAPARDEKAPAVMQVLPRLEIGGVERGTVDITAALTAAGRRAVVVSAGGHLVSEIERAGGEHVILPVDSKNPLTMRRNIRALTKIIAQKNVGLVHARSRAPAWSARPAAQRAKVPFMTTFHGKYKFNNPTKKAYNAIMARGDRVIAISEFIGHHLSEVYDVPKERIRIIPRGVDLDEFNPAAVSAERMIQLTRVWRLPDGAPVVMLPGRFTRWKGHSVLIEAAKRLERNDIRVLLVGDSHRRSGYRAEVEAQIGRIGAEGIVHLTGPCRDMAAAYMLADVVVSASTDPEAFGRVAAEAQAMGRPVIASDHGGARETVIAGETGWLVPPNDAGALTQALQTALTMNEDEREAVARRAISHIHEKFTKPRMCAATLAVYEELLVR